MTRASVGFFFFVVEEKIKKEKIKKRNQRSRMSGLLVSLLWCLPRVSKKRRDSMSHVCGVFQE
jgi:hypothetical protein